MDVSKEWMKQQGWEEGSGLGKNQEGISKPLNLKRTFSQDANDFNFYSALYQNALGKISGKAADPDKVYGGMFVKAEGTNYVKPAVAVEDEQDLLAKCGNRTARRSVKKLKMDESEISAVKKPAEDNDEEEKKKKKKERKEKKEKKKRKKEKKQKDDQKKKKKKHKKKEKK